MYTKIWSENLKGRDHMEGLLQDRGERHNVRMNIEDGRYGLDSCVSQ
jgi:hypothetical protein